MHIANIRTHIFKKQSQKSQNAYVKVHATGQWTWVNFKYRTAKSLSCKSPNKNCCKCNKILTKRFSHVSFIGDTCVSQFLFDKFYFHEAKLICTIALSLSLSLSLFISLSLSFFSLRISCSTGALFSQREKSAIKDWHMPKLWSLSLLFYFIPSLSSCHCPGNWDVHV